MLRFLGTGSSVCVPNAARNGWENGAVALRKLLIIVTTTTNGGTLSMFCSILNKISNCSRASSNQ